MAAASIALMAGHAVRRYFRPARMDSRSHWLKTASLPRFPRLDRDITVDVAVVGAGITGITAAWLLTEAGFKTALIERGRCVHVDTGNTTAHLTAVPDLGLGQLRQRFGDEAARAVIDGGALAIDRIAAITEAEAIPCGFHRVAAWYHAHANGAPTRKFEAEAEDARRLGLDARFSSADPLLASPAVEYANQALFHPVKYLGGLLRRLAERGVAIFENTPMTDLEEPLHTVRTPHGRIRCGHLVLATHTPLMGATGTMRAAIFQARLALYTTYAMAARVPTGRLPYGSFWDDADPYNYLRVERARGGDVAIYGGEDHKTGQRTDTDAAYHRLERRFLSLCPEARITARWSGQVITTDDGLPFIGETAERQFAATGFAGNGMTFGTLSAILAVDDIQGRQNRWQDLFRPGRAPGGAGALKFIRENKDYPYRLVRDWIATLGEGSPESVNPGEGRVYNVGGQRIAASRDASGNLHLCSAVCTHMQCIVAWNPAESTWDCPCHGSRFRPNGEVLAGPAEEPLPPVELVGDEARISQSAEK